MRHEHLPTILTLALLGFLGCAAYVEGPAAPRGGPEVEVSFFYDSIAPYGEWLWVYRPEVRPQAKPEAPGRAADTRPPSPALQVWEREQRRRLEEKQAEERQRPPAGENRKEIEERQQKERQALGQEAERERKVIEKRKQRQTEETSREKSKPEPKPPGWDLP
jgi:hypothetical protein